MQYVFDPVHGLTAILKLADVADDQFETVGIAFDQRNEIFHVPCGEIIQANHLVAPLQQCFAQVGADETGSAGNEYLFFHDCIKCLKRIKKEPFQEILWICEDGRSADVCNAICCCTSY